jgi:acyl-CoA reductase-like NAD-dependent aldehyde dehydrogenase
MERLMKSLIQRTDRGQEPVTGETIGSMPVMSREEVRAVVERARRTANLGSARRT